MKRRLLFVCTYNMSRSPTAEELFKDSPENEARSAGIDLSAVRLIDQQLIDWADEIFVMEKSQADHLQSNFQIRNKKITNLDIPDLYRKNDPELMSILKDKLAVYL